MLDGRHTGTGGGNHIVARRRDRRPTARSCAGPTCSRASSLYWQQPSRRCPTCSRACSSGRPARRRASTRRATTPSTSWRSRSPRCRRPARRAAAPWLVDRLFRNLLVDVTGNTHRAEICIDKLFSPDGADRAARTGRVPRLRDAARCAHEPRPAAALRALVAWFWREPLRGALRALGHRACTTASCCRISSGQDFCDVLDDLRAPATRFDPDWFDAQREFRFPVYGAVEHAGVAAGAAPGARAVARARRGAAGGGDRALRRFIGRAAAGQGRAASTRRRHVVACNGRRVPLRRDRAHGRIRRRRALQGLAAAERPAPDDRRSHAPLTFDMIDTLERPFARRLRLSRAASGRPQSTRLPGQCLRGGNPPPRPLPGPRPFARLHRAPPDERSVEFPTTLDLLTGGPRVGATLIGARIRF